MLKRLAAAFLLRVIARDLTRIATALDKQTLLLDRLTDRFAPNLPTELAPAARKSLRDDTGVSHLDVDEASLALDYVARMEATTGHTPDDDEILIHVADEKTQDLAARLTARDAELTRLMEARR